MSSEFDTQSDMSSELRALNYIGIINDDDDDDRELNCCDHNSMDNWNSNGGDEPLSALPPDIQKLVDEAMKSSDNVEIQKYRTMI